MFIIFAILICICFAEKQLKFMIEIGSIGDWDPLKGSPWLINQSNVMYDGRLTVKGREYLIKNGQGMRKVIDELGVVDLNREIYVRTNGQR